MSWQTWPSKMHRSRMRQIGARLCCWAVLSLLIGAGIIGTPNGAMAQTVPAATAPDTVAQGPVTPDTTVIPPYAHNYVPLLITDTQPRCPQTSNNSYATLPIQGTPRSSSYAPADDPDLNLSVRGYAALPGLLSLVNINGPTDDDAPQLASIFRPSRLPVFSSVFRVFDWDWACVTAPAGQGCRDDLISFPDYTALSMVTKAGESIYPPARRPNILPGGYIALVLYAEEERITITYTREDTPARGYLIHLENFCVDPNLLELYRSLDQAGRSSLPGLTGDSSLGTAVATPVIVAVRDTGSFMDPRSAKDWWQETAARLRAAAATNP